MVLTIGDDDDGLADALLLCETVGGHVDGSCYIGTLRGNHAGVDAREEHLGRDIVAGDGQLDEGITGKDDEPDLIVGEMVDQVLHHHLGTVETTGDDILRPHGVGDIEGDDGLDARALLLGDLRAHLRTGQHDDEQGQGRLEDPELDRGTEAGDIGHELTEQLGVAKLTQFLLPATEGDKPDECQYRNQHQQPEVYGVFESKH